MVRGEDKRSCTQRLCHSVVHLIAWVTCLASISVGAGAVHFLSEVGGNVYRAVKCSFFFTFEQLCEPARHLVPINNHHLAPSRCNARALLLHYL